MDEIAEATYAGRVRDLHTCWRSAPAESSQDGRTTKFVLYSGREVRFNPAWQAGGDVIATREFRLANFRANPVVLDGHDPDRVIGTGTAAIVDADGITQLHGTATWDLHESNPVAILIAGQHARGIRSAVSIGFMPGPGSMPRTKLPKDDPWALDPEKVQEWRAGMFHRRPELFEWSSVSVPKDPGALQLQSWAMEADDPDERIRRVLREMLSAEHAGWVRDAIRADQEVRAAIVALALEQVPTQPPTPEAPADWFEDWS